jgi:hypothetical protein
VPSGAKPKVYDAALVERVRALYASGMTQEEVGLAVGVSQKVIWKLMMRHGIEARVAAKRDQCGERNHMWRGRGAKYPALHLRVQAARGKPSLCEHCGATSGTQFEWASISHRYDDISDYLRLCRSCHSKFDGTVRNLGAAAMKKVAS